MPGSTRAKELANTTSYWGNPVEGRNRTVHSIVGEQLHSKSVQSSTVEVCDGELDVPVGDGNKLAYPSAWASHHCR